MSNSENYSSVFNSVVPFNNVTPFAYRYEDKKYIQSFFDEGKLKISSFHAYKGYADNQLGDKLEGFAINIALGENQKELHAAATVGDTSYCFCASTILHKDLLGEFKRDWAFRINDVISFALEIQRSLSRVGHVLYGNCIYVKEKSLTKQVPRVDLETFKVGDGSDNISLEKLMRASSHLSGPAQFFLKNLQYQIQSEYSIIWVTDRQVMDSIIIECPEARKYCDLIEDL